MVTNSITEAAVLESAAQLVAAYAQTDAAGYFDCFSADADFIFHTESQTFADRASYQRAWADWVAEGWHVSACTSSNAHVRLIGEAAVFTHDVHTVAVQAGQTASYDERETIVFALAPNGGLQAVHEHLSPRPTAN